MSDLNHLKYLYRSRRYLILLVFLVTLLNAAIDLDKTGLYLQAFLSLCLMFALPALTFFFVHDRKAVDTFFSIPVSRRRLLTDSLIFIVSVIYVPLACCILVYGVKENMGAARILLLLGRSLLAVSACTLFNSMLFMLANNVLDGIVVMGAYTMLPLAILIALQLFMRTFVFGRTDFDLSFLGYLSPSYMSMDLFVNTVNKESCFIMSDLGMAVLLVLSYIILYRSFPDRKAERAGTPSDGLFTYPVIIAVYLIVSLIAISTGYDRNYASIFVFIRDFFLQYLFLFAIFMTAHFIYRRKLYFDWKLPVLYVALTAAVLLFAQTARMTRGFGMTYRYIKDSPRTYYDISIWDNDGTGRLSEIVYEKLGYSSEYVAADVLVGDSELKRGISGECLDMLERTRQKAIDDHYSPEDRDKEKIADLFVHSIDESGREEYCQYEIYDIDPDELLAMAGYPEVYISFYTDRGEYRITEDGGLETLYEYE